MPFKSKHPCNKPGCNQLTNSRFCAEHEKQSKAQYDAQRGSACERGYNYQWFKVRAMKLNMDPLCERHLKQGHDVAAVIVHHLKPIETHPELRLNIDNLQSLCNDCHELQHKSERWKR